MFQLLKSLLLYSKIIAVPCKILHKDGQCTGQ